MCAKASAICVGAFVLLMTAALGQTSLPVLDGVDLPSRVGYKDIYHANSAMDTGKCKSRICLAFQQVAFAIWVYEVADLSPGNAWIGEPPTSEMRYRRAGVRLHRVLHGARWLRPEMCRTLVAIAARDGANDDGWPRLAGAVFEIARRISRTGADCLGEVMKLIPPSLYRDHAIAEAHAFCAADRRQDCSKLVP